MSEDMQTSDGTEQTEPAISSRRSLLMKGTVAAAVAAVAGGAMSTSVHAANGDTLYVGLAGTTNATVTTKLGGGGTFQVTNGTTDGAASIYGVVGGSGASGLYGVHGRNTGSEGAGVYGFGGDGGRGVWGTTSGTLGIGVYGTSTGSTTGGVGVRGQSANGPGVVGDGDTFDFQAVGSGRIQMTAASTNPGPTVAGTTGTIARDAAGGLWYCYASNKWRQIAGGTSAGSLIPVTPFRVYDSRRPLPDPGKLSVGQNRVVSVADSRKLDDGSVITANAVPARATAVAFNIAVVNTENAGFLYVADGDATEVGAASINWSSTGQILSNASTVKLNANRQIKVFAGGTTNFTIDISGYYL